MIAVPLTDPRDLTPAQLRALAVIDLYKLRPVSGGWRCPGSPFVQTGTVRNLQLKRLVTRANRGGFMSLVLTGAGRETKAIADMRAQRRADHG